MFTLGELTTRTYIIFDLFHTLSTLAHTGARGVDLHTMLGVSRETVNEALFEGSHDRLTGVISDPASVIADIAARCGASPSGEQCRSAATRRAARFAESLRLTPLHILETLDCLRANGKQLALISNADVTEISGWDTSPLAPRFVVALLSCRGRVGRTRSEIYRLCLTKLGARPDECVFVGDGGSNEFVGAREAGIPSICTTEFICDIFPERVAHHSAQADCVIGALSELCTAT